MEIIELHTGLAAVFSLAIAWFFLHQYASNPVDKLRAKAAANDPEAQYQMGMLCYTGKKKVAQDTAQAFSWFETAAYNGHVRAMVALAGLYHAGEGCKANGKKAFDWYETAAKTGDFEARVNLAVCYLQGIGVEKNETKGFEIMKAAADEKSPLACTLLADMYAKGQGAEKNQNEAIKYYLKAAKQGEPIAKERLKELKGKI